MSLAVGGILVGVFLIFAALMCAEKLSALLALPLMSLAFLLIAVTADLLQPAEVVHLRPRSFTDEQGVARREMTQSTGPSRFAAWKRERLEYRRLLAEKSAFLGQALTSLNYATFHPPGSNSPGTWAESIRSEIERICQAEQSLGEAAAEAFAGSTDPLGRPPYHAGPRADFNQTYGSFVLADRLAPVKAALAAGGPNTASRIQELITGIERDARAFSDRHRPPADPHSLGFRVSSALGYAGGYLVLTLRAGSLSLYATIIATIFGGIFATYVKNLRIAERMVYWTAEFAGERPRVICTAILLVTALVFTSSGGLGTVIMVGTIVLPILRAVGIGPVIAAGVFLIGIAMGGTLYPATRRLWLDFYGLSAEQIDPILWTMVAMYAACGAAWIAWGTRRRMLSNFRSEPEASTPPKLDVPARLMVAPLVPVGLVYLGGVEEITAFLAAVAYMFLCVCRRPGAVRDLSRSMVEGAQVVMPPILLMLGIGVLRTALSTDPVQGYLTPLLAKVTPDSRWSYIATFALAAPLALYRGPLNVWGMGLAVASTLLATSSLPPAAILCALLAAGMLQSVCDPTNTQNVWVAGFQGVTVNHILRHTGLLIWLAAAAAVTVFGFRYVS